MKLIAVIFLIFVITKKIGQVKALGTLRIQFKEYHSGTEDTPDGCCGQNCIRYCRFQFHVCINHNKSNFTTCIDTNVMKTEYEPTILEFGSRLNSNTNNPWDIKVPRILGTFKMIFQIKAEGKLFDEIKGDFDIDQVKNIPTQHSKSFTGNIRGDIYAENQRLDLTYSAFCSNSYLPPDCLKRHCIATDDVTGHYACDSNGNKVCLEGWINATMNCTIRDMKSEISDSLKTFQPSYVLTSIHISNSSISIAKTATITLHSKTASMFYSNYLTVVSNKKSLYLSTVPSKSTPTSYMLSTQSLTMKIATTSLTLTSRSNKSSVSNFRTSTSTSTAFLWTDTIQYSAHTVVLSHFRNISSTYLKSNDVEKTRTRTYNPSLYLMFTKTMVSSKTKSPEEKYSTTNILISANTHSSLQSGFTSLQKPSISKFFLVTTSTVMLTTTPIVFKSTQLLEKTSVKLPPATTTTIVRLTSIQSSIALRSISSIPKQPSISTSSSIKQSSPISTSSVDRQSVISTSSSEKRSMLHTSSVERQSLSFTSSEEKQSTLSTSSAKTQSLLSTSTTERQSLLPRSSLKIQSLLSISTVENRSMQLTSTIERNSLLSKSNSEKHSMLFTSSEIQSMLSASYEESQSLPFTSSISKQSLLSTSSAKQSMLLRSSLQSASPLKKPSLTFVFSLTDVQSSKVVSISRSASVFTLDSTLMDISSTQSSVSSKRIKTSMSSIGGNLSSSIPTTSFRILNTLTPLGSSRRIINTLTPSGSSRRTLNTIPSGSSRRIFVLTTNSLSTSTSSVTKIVLVTSKSSRHRSTEVFFQHSSTNVEITQTLHQTKALVSSSSNYPPIVNKSTGLNDRDKTYILLALLIFTVLIVVVLAVCLCGQRRKIRGKLKRHDEQLYELRSLAMLNKQQTEMVALSQLELDDRAYKKHQMNAELMDQQGGEYLGFHNAMFVPDVNIKEEEEEEHPSSYDENKRKTSLFVFPEPPPEIMERSPEYIKKDHTTMAQVPSNIRQSREDLHTDGNNINTEEIEHNKKTMTSLMNEYSEKIKTPVKRPKNLSDDQNDISSNNIALKDLRRSTDKHYIPSPNYNAGKSELSSKHVDFDDNDRSLADKYTNRQDGKQEQDIFQGFHNKSFQMDQ